MTDSILGNLEEAGEWSEQAACRYVEDLNGQIFFEDDDDPRLYPYEDEAKAICAVCPVRWDCLDWSLRTEERWGIYGGKTYMERRKIVRRRRRLSELSDRLFDFMIQNFLVQSGFGHG